MKNARDTFPDRRALRRTALRAFTVALGSAALWPSPAQAQLDINPPLPNVMLLVDTSGSMERMIDGKLPEDENASCTPGVTMDKTKWNRWATLVQVLTGTIDNFSCDTVDRGSTAFKNEYAWLGTPRPYDYKYHLPFHRLVSGQCVAGPGVMSSTWFDWPSPNPLDPFNQPGAIKYHKYDSASTPCPAPWSQSAPGILDTFSNLIRFGLMTFDGVPDPGTGRAGTAPDAITGMKGLWSYYPGWNGGGAASPVTGNLAGCFLPAPNQGTLQPFDFEVGARNAAAPAWEGRMISPGHFDASLAEMQQTNAQIQEALIAARPYGRTPLGGMLQDATDFLLHDTFPDPNHAGKYLGPNQDPFFMGGCRPTFLVLLSDGEPDPEMRPDCESVNGCPYQKADLLAGNLAALSPNPVKTYVIGFGVSKHAAGSLNCAALGVNDFANGGVCVSPTAELAPCCNLAKIAVAGGTTSAFFANDLSGLSQAFSAILAQISAKSSTSRTLPVFSAASSASGSTRAFQFVSSFNAPVTGDLWQGNLERKRYVCAGAAPATVAGIDGTAGDKFMDNVNMNDSAHPRKFFTAVGAVVGSAINSFRSIRPYLSSDDGLGLYASAPWVGNNPGSDNTLRDGTSFAQYVPAEALGIDAATAVTSCGPFSATNTPPTAIECRERLLRWEVGETNAGSGLTDTRDFYACPAGKTCSELGAIYHSTPTTIGPPRDFLRDASYAEFASQTPGQAGLRPLMLYTATIDGQLHAFKVAATDPNDPFPVTTKANNELWSFLPPAVLPRLLPTYNQRANLLDGVTVVKDVVFQRTRAQALLGAASNGGASWKTVLVGGGGEAGGFYYALDVTDPTKPKFLWQLARNAAGESLFGDTSATPAIATVNLQVGTEIEEVAVAILPGGGAPLRSGSCKRATDDADLEAVEANGNDAYKPRDKVRCWGAASSPTVGPARSVTIARLDTGEVLKSFRGAATDGPTLGGSKAAIVPFDSPMTGVPVPYPADTGKVATRAYIGDADGTLWRLVLVDPVVDNWTAELAWDAYPKGDFDEGQPIATPPIVSIDPGGNKVILFSTGDQQLFTASDGVNTRVWSITEGSEKIGMTRFSSTANWYIPLTNGTRVTGPISLFDSVAYFSTFTPTPITPGSAVCSDGYAHLWGVHFTESAPINQNDTTCPPDPTAEAPYPRAAFPDPVSPATLTYCDKTKFDGSVIFGVSVTQTPSCSTTATVVDPYFGNHTSIASVAPGSFEIVVQTGGAGSASDNSVTKTSTIALPAPTQTTRIDSWACIIE